MMVIEMRKAAQDKAFDLLEEVKDLGYKKKMVLCELEDTLHECFETEEDEHEEDEYETPYDDEKLEAEYRTRGYRRYGRRAMRHMHDDDRVYMRRHMRNRMG